MVMARTIEVGWVSTGRQHHVIIMDMEDVAVRVEIKVVMATAVAVTVTMRIGVTIITMEDLGVAIRMGGDDILSILCTIILLLYL